MRPKPAPRPKQTSNELPPAITALLEQGDTAAADQLQEIGAGSGADAKAARRALYLLKQRGVEPSAPLSPPAPEAAPASRPVVTAYLTNVSGSASQMVLFEEADPFGGASMFHFFLTNFASGLDEIASRRVPHREAPSLVERLKRGEGGLIAPVPVDYARHLVRLAAEKLTTEGGRLPQGYTEALRRIGPSEKAYDRALIYDAVDADRLAEDLSFSREPEQFFQSVYFRSWFLAMEAVVEWEEKYFAAVQSRFAVDQAQREALGDKLIEEAADALLDAKALRSLKRALEEQATVLHLVEAEAEAKQALHHALSLDPELPAHANPFVRFYVKRSIFVVMAYKAELEPEQTEEQPEPEAGPLIERA